MIELYFIKVFPSVGDCFVVGVPESVEDVDLFFDEYLKNVEFWEPLEG